MDFDPGRTSLPKVVVVQADGTQTCAKALESRELWGHLDDIVGGSRVGMSLCWVSAV